MDNLEEKLYDYLNEQTEPKSIGEINGTTEFKDVPRRKLAQTLQHLTAQQIVYRSLKQGKAYYSGKSVDGADLNPVQKNIVNIQAALNGAFHLKEQKDEEQEVISSFADIMRSISALSEELDISGEILATPTDIFELTYNEGIKFENDKYSFAVPDGFVLATGDDMGSEGVMMFSVIEDEEKRDFIAWLPDPKFPDIQEEALISILPSMELDFYKYDFDVRNPEIYSTYFKYANTIGTANMGTADLFETLDIPTKEEAYVCQYTANPVLNQYYVHFFPCKKAKQIRIDVKGVNKENEEKVHHMICELAHGFVSKERPEPIKKLDDASYCGKVLTETIEKEWIDNFNLHIMQNVVLLRLNNLLTEERAKHESQNEQYFFVNIKREFRENLEKCATQTEDVLEQGNTFIKSVSSVNKGNKSLMNIYLELKKYVRKTKLLNGM